MSTSLFEKVRGAFGRRWPVDIAPPPAPPRTYFLELTNYCNLRCSMCNFHSPEVQQRREQGFMPPDVAKRLLAEISSLNSGKSWVALHGAGEPLLHPDLFSILSAGSFPNLDLGFLTNGVLLKEEISRKLVDTPMSWIGFSIDGIDKAKFDRYRCGADYEAVLHNVLRFLELSAKHRPDIRALVNMTVQDEMADDVPEFIRFWLDKVREVCISPCKPVGSRDNPLVREFAPAKRMPCYMLFEMMVVCWDGSVALCCEDWFNDGKMGDATRESLRGIWEGRRFSRCRSLHLAERFDEIGLCGECNSWYNAIPEICFDAGMSCQVRKTAWQSIYCRTDDPKS